MIDIIEYLKKSFMLLYYLTKKTVFVIVKLQNGYHLLKKSVHDLLMLFLRLVTHSLKKVLMANYWFFTLSDAVKLQNVCRLLKKVLITNYCYLYV